jgi:hypothetical protein
MGGSKEGWKEALTLPTGLVMPDPFLPVNCPTCGTPLVYVRTKARRTSSAAPVTVQWSCHRMAGPTIQRHGTSRSSQLRNLAKRRGRVAP